MSANENDPGNVPVRRTSRTRKINPKFAGDEIDEGFMKLIGRITTKNFSVDKCDAKLKESKVTETETNNEIANSKIYQNFNDATVANNLKKSVSDEVDIKLGQLFSVQPNNTPFQGLSPENLKRVNENDPEICEKKMKISNDLSLQMKDCETNLSHVPLHNLKLPGATQKLMKIVSIKFPIDNQNAAVSTNVMSPLSVKLSSIGLIEVKKFKINKSSPNNVDEAISSDGEDDIPLNKLFDGKSKKKKKMQMKVNTIGMVKVKKNKCKQTGKKVKKKDNVPLNVKGEKKKVKKTKLETVNNYSKNYIKRKNIQNESVISNQQNIVSKLKKKFNPTIQNFNEKIHLIKKNKKLNEKNFNLSDSDDDLPEHSSSYVTSKKINKLKLKFAGLQKSIEKQLTNIVVSVGEESENYACVSVDETMLTPKIKADNKYTNFNDGIKHNLVLENIKELVTDMSSQKKIKKKDSEKIQSKLMTHLYLAEEPLSEKCEDSSSPQLKKELKAMNYTENIMEIKSTNNNLSNKKKISEIEENINIDEQKDKIKYTINRTDNSCRQSPLSLKPIKAPKKEIIFEDILSQADLCTVKGKKEDKSPKREKLSISSVKSEKEPRKDVTSSKEKPSMVNYHVNSIKKEESNLKEKSRSPAKDNFTPNLKKELKPSSNKEATIKRKFDAMILFDEKEYRKIKKEEKHRIKKKKEQRNNEKLSLKEVKNELKDVKDEKFKYSSSKHEKERSHSKHKSTKIKTEKHERKSKKSKHMSREERKSKGHEKHSKHSSKSEKYLSSKHTLKQDVESKYLETKVENVDHHLLQMKPIIKSEIIIDEVHISKKNLKKESNANEILSSNSILSTSAVKAEPIIDNKSIITITKETTKLDCHGENSEVKNELHKNYSLSRQASTYELIDDDYNIETHSYSNKGMKNSPTSYESIKPGCYQSTYSYDSTAYTEKCPSPVEVPLVESTIKNQIQSIIVDNSSKITRKDEKGNVCIKVEPAIVDLVPSSNNINMEVNNYFEKKKLNTNNQLDFMIDGESNTDVTSIGLPVLGNLIDIKPKTPEIIPKVNIDIKPKTLDNGTKVDIDVKPKTLDNDTEVDIDIKPKTLDSGTIVDIDLKPKTLVSGTKIDLDIKPKILDCTTKVDIDIKPKTLESDTKVDNSYLETSIKSEKMIVPIIDTSKISLDSIPLPGEMIMPIDKCKEVKTEITILETVGFSLPIETIDKIPKFTDKLSESVIVKDTLHFQIPENKFVAKIEPEIDIDNQCHSEVGKNFINDKEYKNEVMESFKQPNKEIIKENKDEIKIESSELVIDAQYKKDQEFKNEDVLEIDTYADSKNDHNLLEISENNLKNVSIENMKIDNEGHDFELRDDCVETLHSENEDEDISSISEEEKLKQDQILADLKEANNFRIVEQRLKSFKMLEENLYISEKVKTKVSKEIKRMVCDCTLTKEEISNGEMGCGDDCLNKLLMIECGSRCPLKSRCMNKNFNNKNYSDVEVFNAEEKGCGIRAKSDILSGTFLMEYIGEVFDTKEFKKRRKEYAKDSTAHFYFMALRADRLIDATRKGNISRFINHSCSPNAETQKWTVNGDIRIGFFSNKFINAGEEINFDYRLERYGREPQKCYCGTPECRGWLGESPDEKTKEEKEEDRKKEILIKKKKVEQRSLFEDNDLEDEIDKLNLHGLRNKQDTLNLSRLMVRASSLEDRINLLQLLSSAEEICRRLFLDYHGLTLLWSWMVDISSSSQCLSLKLQILDVLKILPLSNKTQLTDSRVLSMVERWSKKATEEATQPPTVSETVLLAKKSSDSDSDSESKEPANPSPTDVASPDDNSLDSSETQTDKEKETDIKSTTATDAAALDSEDFESSLRSVVSLANDLLSVWSDLKEAFRIPKKERIEMMKEHERTLESQYKAYLEADGSSDRTEAFYDRWRYSVDKYNKERIKEKRHQYRRSSKELTDSLLSKEERREKFAQQVAKEEEESKHKKMQEEVWKLHLERCRILGIDPQNTPMFDPSGQFYWDPNVSGWQCYTGPQTSLPVPAMFGPETYPSLNQMMGGCFPPQEGLSTQETTCPQGQITVKLPRSWKMARDQEGFLYFYHTRTRYVQWDIPNEEQHRELMTQFGIDSDSDSSSDLSSSSDSEGFSEDEDDEADELTETTVVTSEGGDEKMIRRTRGTKKRSSKLVQERAISPILFEDREAARRERKEAKERARNEFRKERRCLKAKNEEDSPNEDDEEVFEASLLKHSRKYTKAPVKAKSKERAMTAMADNSETAKRLKESFRSRMATFIVSVLNPFRKPDCKKGRITTNDDFKYLARKLTHHVMVKELKQLPSVDMLECSQSVKNKTKEFVRKYMCKYGPVFIRDPNDFREY